MGWLSGGRVSISSADIRIGVIVALSHFCRSQSMLTLSRWVTIRIIVRLSIGAPCHARFNLRFSGTTMLGMDGRDQIHEKGGHVECEDESNDPLQNCSDVIHTLIHASSKSDGKSYFDDDKDQLYPERQTQDTMLSKMYSQSLVLPANEYGAYHVTRKEKKKEKSVEGWMPQGIKNREADKSYCSNCGKDNRKGDKPFFCLSGISSQAAFMP